MTRNFGTASLTRWITGATLALFAVVLALRALPGRGWSLGAIALLALAALTVGGMGVLFQARRRIGRELLALAQHPAEGELLAARRARLERVARAGGKPSLETLAEQAATAERGRAYLGRYAVAVAVLIGLVGTFSGLADALRALPSILAGAATDPQRLAALLTTPLGGLELTFAAGIVGILSTLALALVQGDLVLHEELALARLEEATAHELVPTLWPAAQDPGARTLDELRALRHEAASVRGLVAEAATTIGAAVAAASDRSSQALADRLVAAVEASSTRLTDEIGRGMKEALRAQLDAQTAITRLANELRTRAEESAVTTRAAVADTRAKLDGAVLGVVSAMESVSGRTSEQLTAALAGAGAQLSATTAAAVETFASTAHQATERLAAVAAQATGHLSMVAAQAAEQLATSASATSAHLSTVTAGASASLVEVGEGFIRTAAEELGATRMALSEALTRSAQRIDEAAAGSARRIDEAMDAGALRLDGVLATPVAVLAEAATLLARTGETLAPQLEALAPELHALAGEVALLGARSNQEEETPLFADELVRLGDGMARLEALMQLSQRGHEGAQS